MHLCFFAETVVQLILLYMCMYAHEAVTVCNGYLLEIKGHRTALEKNSVLLGVQ